MQSPVSGFRRVVFFLLLAACGSRTGLFGGDGSFTNEQVDGGDRRLHRPDSSTEPDAAPPPIDARAPIDVDRRDCPDADAMLVYTITSTNDLQSFNPDTGEFRFISKISCPTDSTPFSMAVDRKGVAYVLFQDLNIYRVSTVTGACIATPYVEQAGFKLFGMGFASNTSGAGPSEYLYIAGDSRDGVGGRRGLARITPGTFTLDAIGPFVPEISEAELTGTGDGRLFAFYRKNDLSPPSYIGQIDIESGDVVGERAFPAVDQGNGWAFAYWAGDFYMFHAPAGSTVVTRWRPSDDSVVDVASTPLSIVGAGVSTCAPQE